MKQAKNQETSAAGTAWLVDAANQAQKVVNYLKYNNPQKPE